MLILAEFPLLHGKPDGNGNVDVDLVTVEMAMGAKLLGVGRKMIWKDDYFVPTVLALVNPEMPLERRTFRLTLPGVPISEPEPQYVGCWVSSTWAETLYIFAVEGE